MSTSFLQVDFSSRVAALRSVGQALGIPNNILPDQSAAISEVTCLEWINRFRAFKSVPLLPGLDYNAFVGAINDLAVLISVPHRYWQLSNMSTDMGTAIAFAEIQFRATAGVPLLFSGGTANASSSYPGPYTPDLAADNNPATFWNSNPSMPQTWGYDYGTGKTIFVVEITIQARPDAIYNEAPSTFTPQWSDDGVAWTSMKQITPALWTAAGQIQTFPVT